MSSSIPSADTNLYLGVIAPIARLIPAGILWSKTRTSRDGHAFALFVLFVGVVASITSGATNNAPQAYVMDVFWLLLTPVAVLSCDPIWPVIGSWRLETLTILMATTLIFCVVFIEHTLILFLVFCLVPTSIFVGVGFGRHIWTEGCSQVIRVLLAGILGILSCLAFSGDPWQVAMAHVGTAMALILALTAMQFASRPLQPIAVPVVTREIVFSLSSKPEQPPLAPVSSNGSQEHLHNADDDDDDEIEAALELNNRENSRSP